MSRSSQRIELLFLWHHHQPDYRSPRTGIAALPWVRLHATKDYLDMALRLERHAGLKATFNFVPSLVDQLQEAEHGGRDALFELLARSVAELGESERIEVLRRCAAPMPRQRDKWPRWDDLSRRAERALRAGTAARMTVRDIEALEAWFLLVWLDPMFRDRPEAQATMRASPPGAAERDGLLDLHRRLLADVLPAYRRLAERGQIELSASPYAHPILPLLVSSSSALRARPELNVPSLLFEAPEDAARQLARAQARHTQVFGAAPRGLWPSEGSVSPEAVALAAAAGYRWMASDEGVLWASLARDARKRDALYRPWRVATEHGDVALFFRDRELSDRIGFVYQHWEARDAVADFLARVRKIGEEHAGETPPVVSVILDGENCWEHYADDGGPFLDALYDALDAATDIATVTPSEVLGRTRELPALTSLHSGSWIDADFHIWIGHPEKNQAWEHIARTRADLVAAGATPESHPECWNALDSAEGSDWFWWLGVDHYTPDKHLFDAIFREHLVRAYAARGADAPAWLGVPIVRDAQRVLELAEPAGFLKPVIDGRATSYYEWLNAGRIEVGGGGSMHRATAGTFRDLWYGFDAESLFLRLDPEPGATLRGVEIEVRSDRLRRFTWHMNPADPGATSLSSESGPVQGARAAAGEILELALPLAAAGLGAGTEGALRIRVIEAGTVLESIPSDRDLAFVVPTREDEAARWSA